MTDTTISQAEDDCTIADVLSEENLDAHRVSASIQAAIRLLLAGRDKARADLKEMTGCRDAAMRYADRQHVPVELDDEIDIDGEFLSERIADRLSCVGWEWESDRDLERAVADVMSVVRPHLARLADRAQAARALRADLGRPWQQWGVAAPGVPVAFEYDTEDDARDHLCEYGPDWNVVTRTVYATRWKAAGGVITADVAPLLQSGCTMPMPSRRTLEQAAVRDARTGDDDD